MKRILIVDFLNSFFTHYHFKDNDKAFKFIDNLRVIIDQFKIDKVLYATEGGKSNYRLGILPTYKGERGKRREEADASEKARYERFKNEEMPDVQELSRLLGIPQLQVWGVEADDIISYVARHINTEKYQFCILSTDGDLWQLLRPGVVQAGYNKHMLEPLNGSSRIPPKLWMNSKQFTEQYGVTPQQYAEVLALAGDASDSIKSPRGLGEGTATKLIQKYSSLAGIWESVDTLQVPRLSQSIKEALKYGWCVVERNRLLVDLWHSPEVELQIFGEKGLAYLEEVLNNLDEPAVIDREGLKEYFFECGKLNVIERLDFWLHPFQK